LEASTPVITEPNISIMDIAERIGKMINDLFSFKTEKLYIEIFHPFESLSKKLIIEGLG
jgi:hypothetical protein